MLGWSLLRAAPRPVTAFCNGHTRRPPAGIERGIHLDDALAVYELFAAEQIVLARPNTVVVRAGLWIGPSASGRVGHLDWLRYRHERKLPMTLIADEVRSAVWADAAARRVAAIARSGVTGIRHITATRAVSRPELAAYLNARFAIGASFAIGSRSACATPHLGRVELATAFADELAAPLPSVVS